MNIIEIEKPIGGVVAFGGQTAIKLTKFLDDNGMLIADEKGYYFDADRGLAYGLKNGSVEVGTIYIFDNNGYLIVSVDEYDYNGVIYVIDAEGKATLKEEDDD